MPTTLLASPEEGGSQYMSRQVSSFRRDRQGYQDPIVGEFAGHPKAVRLTLEGTEPRCGAYDLSWESDPMKASTKSTLAATLIATAVGVGAWFGLAKASWPAHPQMAAFAITIAVSVVVNQTWPVAVGQKRI